MMGPHLLPFLDVHRALEGDAQAAVLVGLSQEGHLRKSEELPVTVTSLDSPVSSHHNFVVGGHLALPLGDEALPTLLVVLRYVVSPLGGGAGARADHAAVGAARRRRHAGRTRKLPRWFLCHFLTFTAFTPATAATAGAEMASKIQKLCRKISTI